MLNLALGSDAFSASYRGLQLFIGPTALYLHLSLLDPDSLQSLNLLFYVFSISHFVALWHPRLSFDTRWLRRLKQISRIQRSVGGQQIIGYAKSLRSTPLGPCKIIPTLVNILTTFGGPSPAVAVTQAQIHSLFTSSPIPCHLADASHSSADFPVNTAPAALFSLLPAPPLYFISPPKSSFLPEQDPSSTQNLIGMIHSLVDPHVSNRRLPTAKSETLAA